MTNILYPPNQLPVSPRVWNINHDSFRPAQAQAIINVRTLYSKGGGFTFQELKTGSGKSGFAKALAVDDKVTVLVHTLGLLYQYRDEYGFDILAGKAEYDCALPDDDERIENWNKRHKTKPTAADCFHSKMSECEYASQCPYIIAREKALNARLAAFTQPMAMLNERVARRTGILVIDECDGSVEGLLNFCETSVDIATIERFGLPDAPYSRAPRGYGPRGLGDIAGSGPMSMVSNWLEDSISRLNWVKDTYEYALSPDGPKAKRVYEKLIRLRDLIDTSDTSWFMVAGPQAVRTYHRGKYQDGPGFSLRSLDARPVASRLWEHKSMCVLMSGTIGNASAFASELGIDKFTFDVYPHPVPKEFRPVKDLKFPRMNWENLTKNPSLYLAQAKTIAGWIRGLNPEWRGIVLTSSHAKVDTLRAMLREELGDRILFPSIDRRGGSKVAEDIDQFLTDPRRGLISVSTVQGWGRGLDLRYDLGRFSVIASAPNSNNHDPYWLARTGRPGGRKYDNQITYSAVEQGAARVSRGERDESGNWLLNEAAICDGKCTTDQAMRCYTDSFKEALI